MATEAQRKAHDLLREQARQQIAERHATNRTRSVYLPSSSTSIETVAPPQQARDVLREMAEGRHPRDILRDIAERRPPHPSREEKPKAPAKKKVKSIPKKIRTLVWNKYIGKKVGESMCVCCNKTTIDKAEFHCGHILAQANGGTNNVTNLRPICSGCNIAMATRDMNEFCKEFFGRGIIETSLIDTSELTGVLLAGAGAGAQAHALSDYETKTCNELRAECKKKEIRGYSGKNKKELIVLLMRD